MTMLVIVTWLWGDKYSQTDVRKLQASVKRHLSEPHRFIVAHPRPEDRHLTEIPGCFCRLRMFDVAWQKENDIEDGDRVVCMDLDSVVTGSLDQLFMRAETFMILQGANSSNPCPFNGSLMMFRASYHGDLWHEFGLDRARLIPRHEFPDDQGWIHYLMPSAPGWKVGSQSGVYAFQKPGWPKGEALPADARLVVFPGWRSPERFKHLPWVKEHWQQ